MANHAMERSQFQPRSAWLGVVDTMRLLRIALVLALAVSAPGLSVAAPPTEAEFRAQIAALYSFEPHKLSRQQMEAKSGDLDAFWSSAKANTSTVLPLLRQALRVPSQSAFFYYDGSKLLLSLSKERQDQALALRSIPKANLEGVQHTDYLRTVHWFAINGFDTREAALRVLDFPEFTAFVPQHALTLAQNYSLIYMLFPMEESVYVEELATRLSIARHSQSQKSVLLALWYASTPAAKAALDRFVAARLGSSEAQAFARELLARRPPPYARATLSSEQSLRAERRKIMSRPISDESLIEFESLTAKIQANL